MEKLEVDYNFIDWWKKVFLKNYANFNGRARRAEFWYYALGNLLIIVPFYILAIVGIAMGSSILSGLGFAVYGIMVIASIVPYLAVAVRRLHDLNKSGWNYFIILIPFIGSIILLVWFCTDGDRFSNNYGDDPKNPTSPEFDFEEQPAM